MSPFGGSASTLTSAQNCAPEQRSMRTIGLTLVDSPGGTEVVPTTPSRSVVVPSKTKSTTVISMSTVPILLMSTV
jgi:hypothetical protein